MTPGTASSGGSGGKGKGRARSGSDGGDTLASPTGRKGALFSSEQTTPGAGGSHKRRLPSGSGVKAMRKDGVMSDGGGGGGGGSGGEQGGRFVEVPRPWFFGPDLLFHHARIAGVPARFVAPFDVKDS